MQLLRRRRLNPLATIAAALVSLACRAGPGHDGHEVEHSSIDAGHVSANATLASTATFAAQQPAPNEIAKERRISFLWSPKGANPRAYAMTDPADQHQITLMQGVASGHDYPLLVAMHGQPRPGESPRAYRFPKLVAEVTRELVQSGLVGPLVLVTPVFRFEGQNWPMFQLSQFLVELRRLLTDARIGTTEVHVFGHSGAAGCGGMGLNGVAAIHPDSVGLFDTCIGEGFLQLLRQMERERIPTLIMHSVETAGMRPRRAQEYDAHFDFGAIYSQAGIMPAACPRQLPDAPLRSLASRCASNEAGSTIALVVDTGQGQAAHEALVPVALRYYLRNFVTGRSRSGHSASPTRRLPAEP